ncbi:MAG: hypothetical protein MUE40_05280 [Anaerolineae bacterium]|nr:hypothetical protein [Anaerolineae bacterium]
MRRFISSLTFFSGLLCLVLAAVFLLPPASSAQDDDAAEYIGSGDCADCHRNVVRAHNDTPHAQTLQNVERRKDAILADFDAGADLRQVALPGEEAPRPFTADDIAFVVGSGRYVQRYLYEVGRNDYALLPAEWDVLEATWRPFTMAETWSPEAYDWEQNCAYCHTTGLDVDRGRVEEEGVQCETCHGPGSLHADIAGDAGRRPSAEELVAIRASIGTGTDPQVCGQCHSRGRSADGQYPFPVGYLPGMTLVSDDLYTLVAPDDAVHWWATGHARQPNMQYNEWFGGAHDGALAALRDSDSARPECLTCHSSDYASTEALRARTAAGEREGDAPDALTLETAQYGVTCTGCHNPHLENADHNSYLAAEPYALCTACHSDTDSSDGLHHPIQQIYEGATIIDNVPGTPSSHFTAEDGPDCITCHMAAVPVENATRASHTQRPIMPGETLSIEQLQDSCTPCHAEQVNAGQMQQLIDDIQNDMTARLERARAAVTADTPAWVTLVLDAIEGDGSRGIHNYTYTDHLMDTVEVELGLSNVAEGPSS